MYRRQRHPKRENVVHPSFHRMSYSFKRSLAFLGLLMVALALPAFLTLRGRGSIFAGLSALKVPADVRRWRGLAEGIPSTPRSEHDIHIVFSTDCSPYQNYQSLVLFGSAEAVEQRGRVTRVASGCSQEEELEIRRLMSKQPERFRVHFTPDYSWDVATGEKFMFYNKPNGMAHFLKYADPPVSEAVIALVDPDMILVSPLTPFVGNPAVMLWHDANSSVGPDWVVEGQPVGQHYGLGGSWTAWPDLKEITKELEGDSPVNKLHAREASSVYPVGPPYLLHPRDWVQIVDPWVKMCPKVYHGHPSILAEMYGYCIAAAHLRLRHRVANGLMVSDTSNAREGWPLVDPLTTSACDASAVSQRLGRLPTVVHYCHLYRLGTFMFGKRRKSLHMFFTCRADSFQLPPENYLSSPMGKKRIHPHTEEEVSAHKGVREGYMLCVILRAMNAAQTSYKKRYCKPEEISGDVMKLTDLSATTAAVDQYGQ